MMCMHPTCSTKIRLKPEEASTGEQAFISPRSILCNLALRFNYIVNISPKTWDTQQIPAACPGASTPWSFVEKQPAKRSVYYCWGHDSNWCFMNYTASTARRYMDCEPSPACPISTSLCNWPKCNVERTDCSVSIGPSTRLPTCASQNVRHVCNRVQKNKKIYIYIYSVMNGKPMIDSKCL